MEALGTAADRVDAWLVAEGVESVDELEVLLDLGVPLAQGFGLGHPTPHMAPIDEAVAQRVHDRGALMEQGEAAALVEVVPAVASFAEAFAHLGAGARSRWVPIVDGKHWPVGLAVVDPPAGAGRTVPRPMRAHPAESLSQVARRAMARPADERFVPLLCCNSEGRYVGLITIERLVKALAASPTTKES